MTNEHNHREQKEFIGREPGETDKSKAVFDAVFAASQLPNVTVEQSIGATQFAQLNNLEKAWVQRQLRQTDKNLKIPEGLRVNEDILDQALRGLREKEAGPRAKTPEPPTETKPEMPLEQKVQGFATLIQQACDRAQSRGDAFSVQEYLDRYKAQLGDEGTLMLAEKLSEIGVKDIVEGEAEDEGGSVARERAGRPPEPTETRTRGKAEFLGYDLNEQGQLVEVMKREGEDEYARPSDVELPDGFDQIQADKNLLKRFLEQLSQARPKDIKFFANKDRDGNFVGIDVKFDVMRKIKLDSNNIPQDLFNRIVSAVKKGGKMWDAEGYDDWQKTEKWRLRDSYLSSHAINIARDLVGVPAAAADAPVVKAPDVRPPTPPPAPPAPRRPDVPRPDRPAKADRVPSPDRKKTDDEKLLDEIIEQAKKSDVPDIVIATRAPQLKDKDLQLEAYTAALVMGYANPIIAKRITDIWQERDPERALDFLWDLYNNEKIPENARQYLYVEIERITKDEQAKKDKKAAEKAKQEAGAHKQEAEARKKERKDAEDKKAMANLGQGFELLGPAIAKKMEDLQKARERYVRAQENIRQYETLIGRFKGWIKGGEKNNAQNEFDAAKSAYETIRAGVVAGIVENAADEQLRVIDFSASVAEQGREKGLWKEVKKAWTWLGDQNLDKLFKAKSGVGRFLGRVISVRTGIMAGLAFGGIFAPGVYGAAAWVGRAAMAGVGGTFASHNIMERWARRGSPRDRLQKLSPDNIRALSHDDALDLIGSCQIDARMRGYKTEDFPNFKPLLEHYLSMEYMAKCDKYLNDRLGEIDEKISALDKKDRRDAAVRKGIALAFGGAMAFWTGVRAYGFSVDEELAKMKAQEAAQATAARTAVAAEAAHPRPSIEAAPLEHIPNADSFGETHSLLRDAGFRLGPDGNSLDITLGVDNPKIDYIQQALRRLVVQEMPTRTPGVFDALDAQKGEIVVARLTQILEQHHTELGYDSAALEKLGISFDGNALKIADYSRFSEMVNTKFFTYADGVIARGNDAYLADVSKTVHRVWQDMLDMKMKGCRIIDARDFDHDPLVQAAEAREIAQHHIQEAAAPTAPSTAPVEAIADLQTHNMGLLNNLPQEWNVSMVDADTFRITVADTQIMGDIAQGKLVSVGGRALAEQIDMSNSEAVVNAIKTPHTVVELFNRPPQLGGLGPFVGIGDISYSRDFLVGIKNEPLQQWTQRYTTSGFHRLWDSIPASQIKQAEHLAAIIQSNPHTASPTTVGQWLLRMRESGENFNTMEISASVRASLGQNPLAENTPMI